MYEGIILTGTSGSGKTTMAHHLSHLPEGFGQVKAVTTRALRPDDPAGSYEYITDADFDRLHTDDKLLVDACYRNDRYGIRRTDVEAVKRAGKTPILILTPESAARLDGNDVRTIAIDHAKAVAPPRYLSVFLDAPDAALDERLRQRGTTVDASVHQQREVDREYRQHFLYVVQNNERQHTVDLLAALWMYATRPGVLPARLILLMLKCGTLLDHADSKNVSGASYDLSLGDEYFYGGRIRRLNESEPILLIEPYDYAIVTSHEEANFPKDVCARFDLSVNLFCQGVILSNGPQVDPGFHGPLFCLLFNTSSSPVILKRRQHYSTLEFHRLVEPTYAYGGEYQGRNLLHYLPANASRGAINDLKKELEQVQRGSQSVQNAAYALLALVLAVIAVLVVLR